MVRIMRKNGDGGYHFMEGTPTFERRQEAMKYLRAELGTTAESDEFLIVGSPTIITAQAETKVRLTSSPVTRGRK